MNTESILHAVIFIMVNAPEFFHWNSYQWKKFFNHHGRMLTLPNSRQFWFFSWGLAIGSTVLMINTVGNPLAKKLPKYLEFSQDEIDAWNKKMATSGLLQPPKVPVDSEAMISIASTRITDERFLPLAEQKLN